jgi:hypothetical protein
MTDPRQPDVITRPRRSAGLRLLTLPLSLLLVVGTVVLGAEIVERNPGSEQVQRPFIHTGQMGHAVDGLSFTATGESVRGAKRVSDDGDVYTTDGVFVLVTVTVAAGTEPVSLAHAALVDRAGRIFEPTSRFTQDIDLYTVQPGIPVRGEYTFELPRVALDGGLILQLSKDPVFGGSNQTVVEIDLGVDPAAAARWLAEPGPLEVASTKVVP